jgi:ribosomal protein S18 acetylase RimI-like enzyme
MVLVVRQASTADLSPASAVWQAANVARGRPPSPQRIERVRQKLAEHGAVVLVAVRADQVVGMVLAEPGRSDADGASLLDLGHISMVFVRPDCQGEGVGGALIRGLVPIAVANGWRQLSLWTRRSNTSARRLYEREGFVSTGDSMLLEETDAIDRWARWVK